MTENRDFKIKICMIGDNYVGKSAIIIRYMKGKFDPPHGILKGTDCECLLHVAT